MAPLRFVGVAIAAVAVFAAGVSASEENPGQQPVIPKFDSVEFAKAAFGSGGDVSSSFPIGSSVRFEVLGQEYEVSRHEDTPEFLTISSVNRSGGADYLGDVGLEEVRGVLDQVKRDEQVAEEALARGESVAEAVVDVARAEGLGEEQAQQVGAAVEVAGVIADDERRIEEDVQALEEDKLRLAADKAALENDLAILEAAAGEAQ